MVTARRRPRREAGYNLVFLIILVSLMGVATAAVLPDLGNQIQRQKEAELIFRGMQYAEGIRVFQQRFGRYPNSLDELIELEPRSMRQLWPDPMADDGRWTVLLAAGQPATPGGGADQEEGEAIDVEGRVVAGGSAPSDSFRAGGATPRPVAGPITGVVSSKKGSGLRSFLGKELYQEWRFTPDILPRPQVIPGTEIVVRAGVEDVGKPFPRGLQPQGFTTGDPAAGLVPGGAPGDPPAAGDEGEDG